MGHRRLLCAILLSFISHEARAYEVGLGLGRLQSCLIKTTDGAQVCSLGPALSASAGFNIWGNSYKVTEQESSATSEALQVTSQSWSHLNLNLSTNKWEDIVLVVVAALFLTSIGYAILYPLSSRMDLSLVTRSGIQSEDAADFRLLRQDIGISMRAYLSQHFPMYIYGNGLLSYQNYTFNSSQQSQRVFIKAVGLGFMSPSQAGPYMHGVWERSTLLEPNLQDIIEDSSTVRVLKSSVAKILDGTYFEAGYIWRY